MKLSELSLLSVCLTKIIAFSLPGVHCGRVSYTLVSSGQIRKAKAIGRGAAKSQMLRLGASRTHIYGNWFVD